MQDAPEVDAAGPVVTSQPDEIAVQPKDPAESAPAQPDAKAEDPEGEKQHSKVQERINKLVGQRLERDRQIAELRRQLEAVQRPQQPQQPAAAPQGNDDKGPQESDFTDYGQFLEARAEWKAQRAAERRFQELQESQTRSQREAQAHEELHTAQRQFVAQAEALASEVPDFAQVAGHLDMSGVLGQALLQSEKGAAVAYFLGLNPSELDRLEGIRNPVKAALEVARLETKAEAALQTRTRSKAPRQGAPLAAAGGVRDDAPESATSMEEYARRYYAKRKRGA